MQDTFDRQQMSLSNLRRNPIDSSISAETITNESHTVAEFTELPGIYGFILTERPIAGTVTVTEDNTASAVFTIVTTSPLPGQVFIDYNENRGYCIFNSADNGTAILVDYDGAGANNTVENTQVIARNTQITGYAVGANTALSATDTILEAFGKVQGQINSTSGGVADQTHAATAKTTPVDADEIPLADSAASWALKKLTFANLWVWIKSKFDSLSAGSTLGGTEKIPMVQSGTTQYTTPADLKTYIGGLPSGAYIQHAGATAPTGYLACDGAAVSRATYAALFAVVSTTYGVGDGSTTFNLPDARGLVMVGAGAHGTMTRANGTAYNGGSVGATRNDQLQGHFHSSGVSGAGGSSIQNSVGLALTNTGSPVTDGTNGTPRTGDETRPAEIAVLVCIKY